MKKYLTTIIAAVVVGAVAFYGGMAYGKSHATVPAGQGARGDFAGRTGIGNFTGGGANAGFVTGSVVSSDAQSVTVQARDGSSKVIFLSASTKIEKPAAGSVSDLAQGTQIVVTGTANSDGSVTAQSIQIRPSSSTRIQ
ncbi:MAG: DUF5666 domain-containing protein [bacterium]|nr:DUF5666 domain-containing protein [bacterium]